MNPYQCDFRKAHSTEFVALIFADTIRRSMDQGQLTGAVLIDLRKAFDTVDHSLLLSKLSALGVTGQAHNWFKYYLIGTRTQVVGFQCALSDSQPVNGGVPRGSILELMVKLLCRREDHVLKEMYC